MSETQPAIVFMGDLGVVSRQGRLLSEARQRGFAPVLLMREATGRDRTMRCWSDPTHPISAAEEIVWVPDEGTGTVIAATQPLLRRYDVRALVSSGEIFVEPIGVLADCLGLPGAGPSASRICRDKLLQRLAIPELSPAFRVVTPGTYRQEDLAGLEFPVVVKPTDKFYSLGVRQVDSPEKLARALDGYPAGEPLLIEERVDGPEFSVESFVQDGEILWAGVTGKLTNESTGVHFTEMAHTCPAEISSTEAEILLKANEFLLHAIRFRSGMTHAELRLSRGKAVLMEVAARMPGDGITFLWELATSEPVEPVVLDLALGLPASYPQPRRRAAQCYLDHPYGMLDGVSASVPISWTERDDRWPSLSPVTADAPADGRAVLVARMRGDLLGPQFDSTQRSVSVIVDAPLGESVSDAAKEFSSSVRISVRASAPVVLVDTSEHR